MPKQDISLLFRRQNISFIQLALEMTSFFACRPHPLPRAPLRIRVPRNVGHGGGAVRSSRHNPRRTLQGYASDGDQRYLADFLFPFRDARQALRRESHLLQDRRIDGAEREVIRPCFHRAEKLGFVMCLDAKSDASAADRGQIGRVKVTLAKMDKIAASIDRLLPVIIDNELRAIAHAERLRLDDFGAEDRKSTR